LFWVIIPKQCDVSYSQRANCSALRLEDDGGVARRRT
jgi:hypothetical protein